MMKTILVAIILFIVTAAQAALQSQPPVSAYNGKVISVEDGKTFTLLVGSKKVRVLLLAIGAPTQALGKESRENLKRLVSGKQVQVLAIAPAAKNGKKATITGKVMLENRDIGLEQVRSGFAWHPSEDEQYQSLEDRQSYSQAEQSAKQSKLGVWSESFKECVDATVPTKINTSAKAGEEDGKKPKVFGTAIVEVTVDESGDVVSARALCGHPILQTLAVEAALKRKFEPKGHKIVGTLTINFVP